MARPRHPFPTKTYNIILSEELYDWVQATARKHGKSGAAYIREILAKEKRIEDRLQEVMDALDAIPPATVPALGDDTEVTPRVTPAAA
jgi:predicted DNA-binding protein